MAMKQGQRGTSAADTLRALIGAGGNRVLLIGGAGLSKALADRAPDWKELLVSGIAFCQEHVGTTDKWAKTRNAQMERAQFPQVAEEITKKLGGNDNGLFHNWLRQVLERSTPTNP